MSNKVHVGWAWIHGTLRPIYYQRRISKGRHKGKFQVEYLAGWSVDNNALRYKKIIVLKSDLQVDLSRSQEEQDLIEYERRNLAKEVK